jgi:UDP-N-acetylglucosamine pyrophosphorylase
MMRRTPIKDIAAVVLAAGKGTRMDSDLPKVIHNLRNKPLILHVIDNLHSAGISDIVAVVGYKGEMVVDVIGPGVKHVWQHEQLGTGHAVMQAENALTGFQGTLILACGDVPLIRPSTFRRLIDESSADSVGAVVLTMIVDKPTGYGRILRDEKGAFLRIVEEKDASPEEKTIREVNTGTYAFDKEFLFQGLKKINRNNAQGEYYLPDALNHVLSTGYAVKTVVLDDPLEGSGINTRDDLHAVESFVAL